MTKEELEKATGEELIEQRNYCGVDGYYGDYLDNVNTEMLKRFNRLNELEKENAELKEEVKNNEDLATIAYMQGAEKQKRKSEKQLAKAREIILKLYNAGRDVLMCRAEEKAYDNLEEAINYRSIEQFLSEVQ